MELFDVGCDRATLGIAAGSPSLSRPRRLPSFVSMHTLLGPIENKNRMHCYGVDMSCRSVARE